MAYIGVLWGIGAGLMTYLMLRVLKAVELEKEPEKHECNEREMILAEKLEKREQAVRALNHEIELLQEELRENAEKLEASNSDRAKLLYDVQRLENELEEARRASVMDNGCYNKTKEVRELSENMDELERKLKEGMGKIEAVKQAIDFEKMCRRSRFVNWGDDV